MRLRAGFLTLWLSLGLACVAGAVDLLPGDVVVIESSDDTIVRVRPDAYDAGDPLANQEVITQGNLISGPFDVAIGDGEIFVTDRTNDSIVRVDLADGSQSNVGGANGVNVGGQPLGAFDPRGIAIDANGKLVVADGGNFAILEIDPDTGEAANLTPNIFFGGISFLALEPDGDIIVVESTNVLSRIMPATQNRQVVGEGTRDGLALDGNGIAYVAGTAEIYRYDTNAYNPQNTTANREMVFDDDADDVGLLPGGDLVATRAANTDLLRIDPDTGMGTMAAEGGNLLIPTGLAVVPARPVSIDAAVLSNVARTANDEAVVIRDNAGSGQAIIKDTGNGSSVSTVNASDGLTLIDAKVISDLNGNGADEIAFLLLASSDSQPKVEARDSVSGARIKNVDYNKQHNPVALAISPDQNGNQSQEGVVLARQLNQNDRPRLLIRDLSTKAKVTNVSLPKIFDPIDVLIGPDLNGNGSNDAYVLSTRISDGKGFVNVWDTGGAGKITNIQLPRDHDPMAQAALAGPGGVDAVAVLALRTSDDRGRLILYAALTGAKLWAATVGVGREPIDVAAFESSSGAGRIAVLTLRDSDNKPVVTVYASSTGGIETNITYQTGTAKALTVFPDVSSDGGSQPELGVLYDNQLRLRDSVSKAVVTGISVP